MWLYFNTINVFVRQDIKLKTKSVKYEIQPNDG